MNTREKATHTSMVSRSDRKHHKRIYFNTKSFTAIFLSAALLLTSVDGMKVQAEELVIELPRIEEVGSPAAETEGESTEGEKTDVKSADYVKTESGAVIITSFKPLSNEVSHMKLEVGETLQQVTERMPNELDAYADAYVRDSQSASKTAPSEDEEGDKQPEQSDEEDNSDEKPGETGDGTGEDEPSGDIGEGEEGDGAGEGENDGDTGEGEDGGGTGEGENGGDTGDGENGGGDTGSGDSTGDGGNGGDTGSGDSTGDGGNGGDTGSGDSAGDGGNSGGIGDGGNSGGNAGDGNSGGTGDDGNNGGNAGGGNSNSSTDGSINDGSDVSSDNKDTPTSGSANVQESPVAEQSEGNDDIAAVKRDRAFAVQEGHQWRLLVSIADDVARNESQGAGGESGSTGGGSENGGTDGGDVTSGSGSGDEGTGGAGNSGDGGTGGGSENGGTNGGDVISGSGSGDEGTGGAGNSGDGETGGNSENGGTDGGDVISGSGSGDEGTGGAGNSGDGGTGSGSENGGTDGGDVTSGSGSGDEGTGGADNSGDGGTGGGSENGGTDGGDVTSGSGSGNEGTDGDGISGGTDGGDGTDNDGGAADDGTGTKDDTEEKAPVGIQSTAEEESIPTEQVTVQVPVEWKCNEADNAELTEYTFYPEWNNDEWYYEGDADSVPKIIVTIPSTEGVTTEDELQAAFNAYMEGITVKITLNNDIELTKPLTLPEAAVIELDGGGHSLLRGTIEKAADGSGEGDDGGSDAGGGGTGTETGEEFVGPMIYMNGSKYSQDVYGTLTLKNIIVNGETKEKDHAGAPAIIDWGHLILEKGAEIIGNQNYGTERPDGDSQTEEISARGGGVQVYRRLTVREGSSVKGNYADQCGGGVYLGKSSTLYLHADVLQGNTVKSAAEGEAEPVGGPNLYADAEEDSVSTIFYDENVFSFDLENEENLEKQLEEKGFKILGSLIPLEQHGVEDTRPDQEKKEVYICVAENSGYSSADVQALKEKLTNRGYTVINRTDIDTTDLRDWAVYDHYDTAAWGEGTTAAPPQEWKEAYKEYQKRDFYPCTESKVSNKVMTLKDWLDTGSRTLAQFTEHIYSGRDESGLPRMSLVGYGREEYVDFLFYTPASQGEKVVDFDVNSAKIDLHTLKGNGFLINTGVTDDGTIKGYVVFYTYKNEMTNLPEKKVTLYKLKDGLTVEELHGCDETNNNTNSFPGNCTLVKSEPITESEWSSDMSVQIKVTPTEVEVRQQPKSPTAEDASGGKLILKHTLDDTGYTGYGPLVAYGMHNCSSATTFTYSNLRMYYTDGTTEGDDDKINMLSALEKADYTQGGTQKYFINLFGKDSKAAYNPDADYQQYQEYIGMMQKEGIALITDRETPFEEFLGESGKEDSNLFEFENGKGTDGLLSVDDLVKKIDEFVSSKEPQSTDLTEKINEGGGDSEGGLTPAHPTHSVGNIWLRSVQEERQIRTLYRNNITDGYGVQIMDDIAQYQPGCSVKYELLGPGRFSKDLGTATSFSITDSDADWPLGQYTVVQTVFDGGTECIIKGYAYFRLSGNPEPKPQIPASPGYPNPPTPPGPSEIDPPVAPDPQAPLDPPEEPEPEPEPDQPKPGPKPSKPSSHSEPAKEEVYIEETVEISAGEPVSVPVPVSAPAPEEPEEKEKGPHEPKTGDMPVPAMPVSVGACTAFMMKLRLWLYELETGISEEKKNEILRGLIGWAKGTSMLRIYMAIAATAVVLTAYHLLRAIDARRRQVVEWFGR